MTAGKRSLRNGYAVGQRIIITSVDTEAVHKARSGLRLRKSNLGLKMRHQHDEKKSSVTKTRSSCRDETKLAELVLSVQGNHIPMDSLACRNHTLVELEWLKQLQLRWLV